MKSLAQSWGSIVLLLVLWELAVVTNIVNPEDAPNLKFRNYHTTASTARKFIPFARTYFPEISPSIDFAVSKNYPTRGNA